MTIYSAKSKKITLKYGQCVGVGVLLVSKLVAVSEKAGDDLFIFFIFFKFLFKFFSVFTSSLAGMFVKLKPTLKFLDPPLH